MGVRLVQQLTASVVCCSLALQSWMRLYRYARAPWRCYGTRAQVHKHKWGFDRLLPSGHCASSIHGQWYSCVPVVVAVVVVVVSIGVQQRS